MAFAVADQSSRVRADLQLVTSVESASTEAALYRANLAIAVAAAAAGDRETVEAAVEAARNSLDRIDITISGMQPDLEALWAATETVASALQADDPATATAAAVDTAGPALNRISSRLAGLSADLQAAIEAEQAEAGRAARLSSFSAALLAPALVLWSFRSSSRRRLERQTLEAELRRTHELSRAKDELIAGLSHQLRTPLTGIQGFSAALLDQARTGELEAEVVEEMVATVHDEAKQLARMIDDFLIVARADAGALSFVSEPFDLAQVVRSVADGLAVNGRRMIVEVEEGLVLSDSSRVRQLLVNLIDNAFKHGHGPVAVIGSLVNGRFMVQVVDHGPGIEAELLARALDGFLYAGQQATVVGTMGLGLRASSILARGLGSELTYNRIGQRTVLEFALPAQVADAANSYSLVAGSDLLVAG